MTSMENRVPPGDLRAGDVITYETKDPIFNHWRPAGVWVVTCDAHERGTFIDVDDDGCAVEVESLNIVCTSTASHREELKPFPIARSVEVIRREPG